MVETAVAGNGIIETMINVLHITATHIEKGRAGSNSLCPLALALIDTGYELVSVNGQGLGFWTAYKNEKCWRGTLPQSAQEFMRKYDLGLQTEPFQFETQVI